MTCQLLEHPQKKLNNQKKIFRNPSMKLKQVSKQPKPLNLKQPKLFRPILLPPKAPNLYKNQSKPKKLSKTLTLKFNLMELLTSNLMSLSPNIPLKHPKLLINTLKLLNKLLVKFNLFQPIQSKLRLLNNKPPETLLTKSPTNN